MKTKKLHTESEKLIELEKGLSIWKIGIDALREQDKNARYMSPQKFNRLQDTIKKDKRLESLPFVMPNPDRENEFLIISGAHRTRAARMAGRPYVYSLVDESNLKRDYMKSKQLAHNALQGQDDLQLLAEIYESIEDVQARIETVLSADDLLKDMQSIDIDELAWRFDTQHVSLLFTKKGFKDFETALVKIEKSDKAFLADFEYFEELVKTARKVSKRDDIRNMTGIIVKMCQIVNKYYEEKDKTKK